MNENLNGTSLKITNNLMQFMAISAVTFHMAIVREMNASLWELIAFSQQQNLAGWENAASLQSNPFLEIRLSGSLQQVTTVLDV